MSSRLLALLSDRRLSTAAVARLADLPQSLVWRYAHGTTPKGLVSAHKLAAALRVRVTDIWPELVVGRAAPTTSPQHRVRRASTAGGGVPRRATITPMKAGGKRKTGR